MRNKNVIFSKLILYLIPKIKFYFYYSFILLSIKYLSISSVLFFILFLKFLWYHFYITQTKFYSISLSFYVISLESLILISTLFFVRL